MQDIHYIDHHFIKENSSQHILSIRYATDGLSFCIHDFQHKLLGFAYRPYQLDSQKAVMAKVKRIIQEEELLNLAYGKVYILACHKEKILLPADYFSSQTLNDLYRICLASQASDMLLYHQIQLTGNYLIESLPRDFVNFLYAQYPALCLVNHAYPFIIDSISHIQFNTPHLFINIHDRYFDLLLTRNNDILLFNSFDYESVTDLIYFALNCLEQCQLPKENVYTFLSGNLVNDSNLLSLLKQFLPNASALQGTPLSQLVRNNALNNSSFIHLLNIHQCE